MTFNFKLFAAKWDKDCSFTLNAKASTSCHSREQWFWRPLIFHEAISIIISLRAIENTPYFILAIILRERVWDPALMHITENDNDTGGICSIEKWRNQDLNMAELNTEKWDCNMWQFHWTEVRFIASNILADTLGFFFLPSSHISVISPDFRWCHKGTGAIKQKKEWSYLQDNDFQN